MTAATDAFLPLLGFLFLFGTGLMSYGDTNRKLLRESPEVEGTGSIFVSCLGVEASVKGSESSGVLKLALKVVDLMSLT